MKYPVHRWDVWGSDCAAIVGDITPNDGISKEKKAQLEADAIKEIQKMLGAESSVGVVGLLPASMYLASISLQAL